MTTTFEMESPLRKTVTVNVFQQNYLTVNNIFHNGGKFTEEDTPNYGKQSAKNNNQTYSNWETATQRGLKTNPFVSPRIVTRQHDDFKGALQNDKNLSLIDEIPLEEDNKLRKREPAGLLEKIQPKEKIISPTLMKKAMELHESREWTLISDEYRTEMRGYLLILLVVFCFVTFLFWTIFAKMLTASSTNPLIEFVAEDQYYCWLFPLLAPITFLVVYCNWASLKFFRHN